MHDSADRLGQLLIAAGMIDGAQLQAALKVQQQEGVRLGEALVRAGHLTEAQITQVLSNQLSVAWVSLDHVQFTDSLASLVPAELAKRHMLVPVHARRDGHRRHILYVAMEDPTDVDAMRAVSAYADMHVRPLIAPPSDVRRFIALWYPTDEPEHAVSVPP